MNRQIVVRSLSERHLVVAEVHGEREPREHPVAREDLRDLLGGNAEDKDA